MCNKPTEGKNNMTKRNEIDGESYLDPCLGQSIDERAYMVQKEGGGFCRVVSWIFVIIAAIVSLLFAMALQGCATPPTTEQIDAYYSAVTNSAAYAEIAAKIEAAKDKPDVPAIEQPTPETPIPVVVDSAEDAVPFSALQWSYGGWNGSGAKFDGSAVIGGLSVSNSGMSYSWKSGGCESIGAGGGGDYSQTMACLFQKESDGVWRGGKFDWISTSRTTRSFSNIHGGYHDWNAGRFKAAKEFAFVIVSRGGYRTNVIKGGK
jgi:hypothetical protein